MKVSLVGLECLERMAATEHVVTWACQVFQGQPEGTDFQEQWDCLVRRVNQPTAASGPKAKKEIPAWSALKAHQAILDKMVILVEKERRDRPV